MDNLIAEKKARPMIIVMDNLWRRHYNEVRPHSSLGYLTPAEFKAKHLAGSVGGGRSPAMAARAAIRKNEEPLTGPIGAILQ